MAKRLVSVSAGILASIAPAVAIAQPVRQSPLPSYSFVQLSVASAQIAPAEFQSVTAAIRSCNEAKALGEALGAKVTRHKFVHQSELPPQLRPVVEQVQRGRSTPVLSEDGSALHVLVVCHVA
ncbi:hypothetical protein [Erythrobacter sp.]|uniref:hypothetical protein n=1 Tax=Erythrobacter sp. TaxID=1042 RepID=UPI0025E42E7D|nr:hypothetical protein [Erythrobacter sp.]